MPIALDALLDRRSIRKYTAEAVSQEAINSLLAAGFYAPSSRNLRPCHFIVVTSDEMKEKFGRFHPSAVNMIGNGAIAVIVCGDITIAWDTWRDDAAAATTNIVNAAQMVGLGSCWCGLYPRDQRVYGAIEALGLPKNILPYSMILVGHAAEEKARPQRIMSDRIHLERWTD